MDLLSLSKSKAEKWLQSSTIDSATKEEVKKLLADSNPKNLIDSFYKELEFGTGARRVAGERRRRGVRGRVGGRGGGAARGDDGHPRRARGRGADLPRVRGGRRGRGAVGGRAAARVRAPPIHPRESQDRGHHTNSHGG